MAKPEAEVTIIDKFKTRYDLPGGISVIVRKPTNRVRRLLVEAPDQRIQFMDETVAAACIAKMTIPADYVETAPEGKTVEFTADDLTAPFSRYDEWDLVDQVAFTIAFQHQNTPTKPMMETLLEQLKAQKAVGPKSK